MYVYIWYLKFKRKRGSCASPIMTALLWKGLLPIRDSGCKLCKNPNNSWRWLAHLNQTGNKKIWTFDQSISLKMLYFNSLMVGFLWIFFSDQTESFYKCSDAKSPVKSSINAPLPSLFMQELTHLWWQTLIRLKSCAISDPSRWPPPHRRALSLLTFSLIWAAIDGWWSERWGDRQHCFRTCD